MRVLWLFGPPGVGKSTTAWEVLNVLCGEGTAAAYVDIDQLAMVYPAPDDDPYAERLAGGALAAVAAVHQRRGADCLVVSGVLNPDLMSFYVDALAAFELSMVRLTVDRVELRARMDARGVDDAGWEEVLEDVQVFDDAALETPVVVAGGASPREVARHVLAAAADAPLMGDAEPGRVGSAPVTKGAGEALLIGGTQGVGKSSVAWTAFMTLRERGIAAGFLDLRQIGFSGRDGGPVDHELQAAVLAALWPLFQGAGAEVLLLNGPVDNPDQAQTYAAALRGTPLVWHKLTASQSALTARVLSRRTGENTARLAGDTLGGLDAIGAHRVALGSFAAQQRADAHSSSTTLDTSHLSVGAVAERVLRGVRWSLPGS